MTKLKLGIAAAVVIAAAVTTAAVAWSGGAEHDDTVLVASGHGDDCWYRTAAETKDWVRMAKVGVEFGKDQVVLKPSSGQVTVTKAELIDPQGGIRLIKAVFAPYAGFAIGFFGEDFRLPPYLADKIQELPARLTSTPKPAGAPPDWDPAYWQVAVVVSAPVSATNAFATGVKLTYRSGSTERTVNTTGDVRLVRQRSLCPSPSPSA